MPPDETTDVDYVRWIDAAAHALAADARGRLLRYPMTLENEFGGVDLTAVDDAVVAAAIAEHCADLERVADGTWRLVGFRRGPLSFTGRVVAVFYEPNGLDHLTASVQGD